LMRMHNFRKARTKWLYFSFFLGGKFGKIQKNLW
jgi:hypothetical protein